MTGGNIHTMLSLFTTRTRFVALAVGVVGCFLYFIGCTIPAWITYRKETQVLSVGLFMTCIGYKFDTCTTEFEKDNLYAASQILGSLGLVAYIMFAISASLTFFWTKHWKILKVLKLGAGSLILVAGILITMAILTILQSSISENKSLSHCGYLGLVSCVMAFLLTPFYVIDGIKTAKEHEASADKRQKRRNRTELAIVPSMPPENTFILDRSPVYHSRDFEDESKEKAQKVDRNLGKSPQLGMWRYEQDINNKKIKKNRPVKIDKRKQIKKNTRTNTANESDIILSTGISMLANVQTCRQASEEQSFKFTIKSERERRAEESLNGDLNTTVGISLDNNFTKSNKTEFKSNRSSVGPGTETETETLDKENVTAVPSNIQIDSVVNKTGDISRNENDFVGINTDTTESSTYNVSNTMEESEKSTQNLQTKQFKKRLNTREKSSNKDLPHFFKDSAFLNDGGYQ